MCSLGNLKCFPTVSSSSATTNFCSSLDGKRTLAASANFDKPQPTARPPAGSLPSRRTGSKRAEPARCLPPVDLAAIERQCQHAMPRNVLAIRARRQPERTRCTKGENAAFILVDQWRTASDTRRTLNAAKIRRAVRGRRRTIKERVGRLLRSPAQQPSHQFLAITGVPSQNQLARRG